MFSLFSLFVVKSPLFIGMALGAVLVVVCTLLTAWTMPAALLAALGDTATGKAEMILLEKLSLGLPSPVQILAWPDPDRQACAVHGPGRARGRGLLRLDPAGSDGRGSPRAPKTLEKDACVASTLAQIVNVDAGSNRTIVTVVTRAPIDSIAATDLVREFRDDMIPSYRAPAAMQVPVVGRRPGSTIWARGRSAS